MPDHIKASIERLFHKIPAMKFPLISKSSFPNIYHFTVNTHCMHFLPGAPLTASSGALIFVPQTGFAEICFSIILSPANRKKWDISFGRTNLQLRRSSSHNANGIKVKYLLNLPEINIGANLQIFL